MITKFERDHGPSRGLKGKRNLFQKILKALPRPELDNFAHYYCGVLEPKYMLRADLEEHLSHKENVELRTEMNRYLTALLLRENDL